MTKGFWSCHNETAASAWQQQNTDWWSEMKPTNHNTHHPENSPTNRCGMMDTDDEAAGRMRNTDLNCIIAALEGHEKKPIHYHALRNNYTSLICASYMANHPYENVARSPIFKQKNIQTTNNLDGNSFSLPKMRSDIHKLKPKDLEETIIEKPTSHPGTNGTSEIQIGDQRGLSCWAKRCCLSHDVKSA